MRYIEPHGHMVSRTTDDYVDMAAAGCACVCEPAFWAGFDRSSVHGFYDYFCQLTDYEPKRAARFGLAHYCWLCINPKESEDVGLAAEVIADHQIRGAIAIQIAGHDVLRPIEDIPVQVGDSDGRIADRIARATQGAKVFKKLA